MRARRARGSSRRPPVVVDRGGRGASKRGRSRACRHRRLLVVGSACVSRLSRRAGAQDATDDGGRVAAVASDLVSRPALPGRRFLVGRRHERWSLAHAPTPSCCAGGRRPLRRCRAAGELVNVSRAKSRRQGASEKKKEACCREGLRGARMPPTPVLCGTGCRRAASQPRPPSSAAARSLLPTLAARARVLRSRGQAREVQGCGAAGRCGPAAPCSAARAAAAADGRRRATSRGHCRVAALAARQPPRPLRGRPEVGARMPTPMLLQSHRARTSSGRGNRTPWRRALRAPVSRAGTGGNQHSSIACSSSSLLLRSRGVPGGRLQHEAPVAAGVPSLLEPGRNLPPSAGPSATPPRRPHMPSAAALRVTFAPGCCSSFLPSARLSSRPPALRSRPANAAACIRLGPYHAEHTPSRPIWEVKQRRARLVLAWVTGWESRVPKPFVFLLLLSTCSRLLSRHFQGHVPPRFALTGRKGRANTRAGTLTLFFENDGVAGRLTT